MSAILVTSQIREGESQASSKEYLFPQLRSAITDKSDYREIELFIPGLDSPEITYRFGVTNAISTLLTQLKTKDNTSYNGTVTKIGGFNVNNYSRMFNLEETAYIESLGEGLGCKLFIIEEGGIIEYEVTQDIDTIDNDLIGSGGAGGGGCVIKKFTVNAETRKEYQHDDLIGLDDIIVTVDGSDMYDGYTYDDTTGTVSFDVDLIVGSKVQILGC